MQVAVFSAKSYDRKFLDAAAEGTGHQLRYFEARLAHDTAGLARGFPAVCIFVNDEADAAALRALKDGGTGLLACRCAGVNQVDLNAARDLGVTVTRVPAYSPHAVAEYAVGLILTLNRNIHRAYNRVREGNFALDGLMGFDLFGKTVGVVGTGKIGSLTASILKGFGCEILAHDTYVNPACTAIGARYVGLDELLAASDVVTLHCPLTPETHHLVNARTLAAMKPGAMLINTSRGDVIDTGAVVDALKSGRLGYLGLDVYEEEEGYFFEDFSSRVIKDDVLARLLTFPNVLITGHQAFFTREAIGNISRTVVESLTNFEQGRALPNWVEPAPAGS
ncbi:2-hydroxyacid dehydrogenase [Planctomyces sp. SH-PL62]|uniref:2-hydroxyacid dehydrogenase n=1 Tax=Planctomyces sp. SH-PL62 TaxID=1636152 RepID=UPI00078B88CE|nr:2-hydroxyacid dehydrogenase [Planctomyces sp. SH-PL62]AMV36573.1 D-lactate dehydrogenase [Planctomyces sp. SH-PL62]